jgi:hypothetical protein
LLNGGDWIEIKILATQFDGPVQANGRIVGVKIIQELDSPDERIQRFAERGMLFSCLQIITLLILAAIAPADWRRPEAILWVALIVILWLSAPIAFLFAVGSRWISPGSAPRRQSKRQ